MQVTVFRASCVSKILHPGDFSSQIANALSITTNCATMIITKNIPAIDILGRNSRCVLKGEKTLEAI